MPRGRAAIFDTQLEAGPAEAMAVGLDQLQHTEKVRELGFLEWAGEVPEERGPLDLARFRFQVDLYGQRATSDADMVVKKGTQVGVSTWLMRWVLFWADMRSRTALYVFPTERTLHDFSQQRIAPVLRRGRLESRVGVPNNQGLRKIGLGWVYFRGAAEAVNLESIPADVLALDEYDSLDQGNIGVAEQRVTGPMSEGLIRRVGVPSVPGFGISKLYEKTSKSVWMVRCGCGEFQAMLGSQTYRENVDEETRQLVCRKCRRRLDVISGEWVAEHPDAAVMGYWIPKFVVPGIDIGRIIDNHHKTSALDKQTHYNRDLGEEYAPAEGRLSKEALLACTRPGVLHFEERLTSFRLKTMGVDVASARALNVRVSEHLDEYNKRALWIGTLSWSEHLDAAEAVRQVIGKLGDLMVRYEVNMAAIDHLPENRLARSFAARYPGRVYLASYNTAAQPKGDLWNIDDGDFTATVHRTTAIDATLDGFRQQRNLLPGEDELPAGYVEHMGNLIRMTERDEKDKVKQFYRATGPDDFAQAEVYDLIATELFYRQRGQQELETAQRTMTPSRQPDEQALDEGEQLDEGEWGMDKTEWR